jgi:hypothetical protein
MMWNRDQVEELCQQSQERINAGVARDLMCRLASEEPPNDPRHLTDTRTRVSTLLEYALGYEANEILRSRGQGHWLSCVLWNVFPDLLLRSRTGAVEGGLEVKALHTAAEEKSANLSTPLSKIRATGDYLIIMNWGWERSSISGADARYPHIHFTEVFDAHLIARIRDFTWLCNQRGRVKGIDCSTPIISVEGDHSTFKAEEGNLGKLMRIRLADAPPEDFPNQDRLIREAERFKAFQDRILGLALTAVFKEVCFGVGGTDIETIETIGYPASPTRLGNCTLTSGSTLSLWAGNRVGAQLGAVNGVNNDTVLWLGAKLKWKVFMYRDGQWLFLKDGTKAENSVGEIDDVVCNIARR